jgi:hypothetical protein
MTDSKTSAGGPQTKFVFGSLLFFSLVAGLLSFSRLANPAFGAQGDLPVHYHLTRAFNQSLTEGNWLPRWAGLLDGGRGDAFFTFYPPIFYWLTAVLARVLRTDIIIALKLASFLCLLLAQINTYFFARIFFTRKQSLLAAALFVLLPAYSLITLHRAFLPNGLALCFVPLVLLATHRLLLGEKLKSAFVLFALSLSVIICTHVITTYLCAIVVGLMALTYLSDAEWAGLKNLSLAGLAVLALTAFFWAPQQIEMSWVNIKLQTTHQDFRNYFLFAPAPDNNRFRQSWAELNYAASWITLLQTALVWLVGMASWRKQPSRIHRLLLRFCLALSAFGLLISLPLSRVLWERLPGLAYLQFPWRLQPLTGLCAGLSVAYFLACREQFSPRGRNLLAACLTWLLLINFAFTYFIAKRPKASVERAQLIQLLEASNLTPLTTAQRRDLESKEDLTYLSFLGNQTYFRPLGADLLLYPASSDYGGLTFISGRGQILAQHLTNQRRQFSLLITEPVRARFNTYHYPHWMARLDGRELGLEAEPGSGLILFDLPAGRHTLTLDYEVRLPLIVWARRASIAAWLGCLAWVIWLSFSAARRLVNQPYPKRELF